MAKRGTSAESQGKTIALIISYMIAVALGVMAYMYYDETDRLKQIASDAQKKEGETKKLLDEAKSQYNGLRELMFGPSTEETHPNTLNMGKQQLDTPKLSTVRLKDKGRYETYQAAVDWLQKAVEEADKRIEGLDKQKIDVENELKAVKAQYQAEVDKAREAQQAKETELAQMNVKFEEQLKASDEKVNELTSRLGKSRDEHEQLGRDSAEEIKKLQAKIKNLTISLENIDRQTKDAQKIKFEHADGHIVNTSAAGDEAFVDVGFADGVKTGMTFGVYARDAGGNYFELPKANIEITRILEGNRAVGKLTRNPTSDPVLQGDAIYNPVWSPGHKEGVAFAGMIFLDDDDNPDNEAFKRLVIEHGGVIDCEANSKTGELIGAITTETGWLVIGENPPPSESKYAQRDQRQYQILNDVINKMKVQANDSGVRVVNYRNFLTYMGHDTPQRNVQLGDEYKFLFKDRRPRLESEVKEKPRR